MTMHNNNKRLNLVNIILYIIYPTLFIIGCIFIPRIIIGIDIASTITFFKVIATDESNPIY